MNNPPPASSRESHLAALDKSFAVFLEAARRPLLTKIGPGASLLRAKPNEKAFSLTEILYHMLDVERLWQRRLRGLLDGSMTHFQQMDPDKEAIEGRYNEKPYEEGIQKLIEARGETVQLVQSLSTKQLQLKGIHSRYGEMDIHKILETMEGHDRTHAAQIERTIGLIRPPF